MKEIVLEFMVNSGKPLKCGEIAEALNADKVAVDKAIKELVKEGKAESPKRCFYIAK